MTRAAKDLSVSNDLSVTNIVAGIVLPTDELGDDIPFHTPTLGMRLDAIFPADDPRVGVFSGQGIRLRFEKGAAGSPGMLRLRTGDPDGFAQGWRTLTAPNGTRIEIDALDPPLVLPAPQIRHRALHASDNVEVIEIGVPAEHVTNIDHDMTLPNDRVDPNRRFDGQRFVHHRAGDAECRPFRLPGFVARDTAIAANTGGVAGVMVARRGEGDPVSTAHDAGILFTFVMEGSMVLEGEGRAPQRLGAGDAFVIPPGIRTRYADPSDDVELLEVTLPGNVETNVG